MLKEAGLPAKVVMKPAAIRSDCGLAVRVEVGARDEAVAALCGAKLEPRSQHTV